jgi:hypothetical protein
VWTFREMLLIRQRELGLSDAKFAHKLGLTTATWDAIRTGRRRMNVACARGAAAAFPDLREQAHRWLLFGDQPILAAEPAAVASR